MLEWVPQNYTNRNTWQKTLDYNIVTRTIERVVAQQFSSSVKTEVCLRTAIEGISEGGGDEMEERPTSFIGVLSLQSHV